MDARSEATAAIVDHWRTGGEVDQDADAFERRCSRFAPDTTRPFIPATRRLAWASNDTKAWPFNHREVMELRGLIGNLLDQIEASDV